MTLLSGQFYIFCIVVVLMYYSVFRKLQWVLLLLASILFYVVTCGVNSWYILVSILTTYAASRIIGSLYGEAADPATSKKIARLVLLGALFVTLGLLVCTKYLAFLTRIIGTLLNLPDIQPISLSRLSPLAPLGISYYTFCVVGYLLDVYWKRTLPEKNILKYGLFVLYFPQLFLGPIARYKQLSPQFFEEKRFDIDSFKDGLVIIFYGLFQKIVIANRLSAAISPYFDQFMNYSGWRYLIILCLYSFLIYADFAGAINIVSGVSKLLGIRLSQNFRHPFMAKTIPEFWQRWHISLGSWFKDYVFFPVSISKVAKKINGFTKRKWGHNMSRMCSNILPLFTVWMLTGLWHGASLSFLAWGMYYFILFLLGVFFAKPLAVCTQKFGIRTKCLAFRLFQMARTFILCSLGRAFFRAPRLMAAFSIIGSVFQSNTFPVGCISSRSMIVTYLAIVVMLLIDVIDEHTPIMPLLNKQRLPVRWFCYIGLIFAILILGQYGPGVSGEVFAYERF